MKYKIIPIIAILSVVFTISSHVEAQNHQQQLYTQQNGKKIFSLEEIEQYKAEGIKFIPDISYREDYEACKLDLAMPTKAGTGQRPAIVVIHGGGWRNGDKRKGIFIMTALDFAARGYVCISINYRLLSDSTSIATCVEDTKCAVRWLRACRRIQGGSDAYRGLWTFCRGPPGRHAGYMPPFCRVGGRRTLAGVFEHGTVSCRKCNTYGDS